MVFQLGQGKRCQRLDGRANRSTRAKRTNNFADILVNIYLILHFRSYPEVTLYIEFHMILRMATGDFVLSAL